jgi:hypothetical protein
MSRFARPAAAALVATALLAAEPVEARPDALPPAARLEPRAAAVAEEVEPAVLTPNLFRGPRAFEWSFTVLGGGYRGPLPQGDAGALELGLGIGWPSFAAGLRLSMIALGRDAGFGTAVQLGPRFRLGERGRLELMAELGADTYSSDQDVDLIVVSAKTTGSSVTLPAAGLRAGVTLLRAEGRSSITLGAMFRWVKTETVTYQTGACVMMVVCGNGTRTSTYGGAMVGAYLTFSNQRSFGI